jgi:hydrogenase expression/formation protein HypD
MIHVDEYRDAGLILALQKKIHAAATKPITLMEICGGQTHSIVKHGLDQLLPETIQLVHGPGCPVCVTPIDDIDRAIAIAMLPDHLLLTYGDMMRVPGSKYSLLQARSAGASIQNITTATECIALAQNNPQKMIVMWAIGFETTAPMHAWIIDTAIKMNLKNLKILCSHVTVPPALEFILSQPDCRIDGILAAGHVCTVDGISAYEKIAQQFDVPIAITGFEPVDILEGIMECIEMINSSRTSVSNIYSRVVRTAGNLKAQEMVQKYFEACSRDWRGIGSIPGASLNIRKSYAHFDARLIEVDSSPDPRDLPSTKCHAAEVLLGHIKPHQCPSFGKTCSPSRPLGAPMVSTEGACSAYYLYRGEGHANPMSH